MSDIFTAAEEGNLARVKELLAQGGLDLAALDPYRNTTALYFAAHSGHLDVAEALIRAGAPLNVPDEFWSPLHGVVQGSHHDLAAMLLREGAQVDADSKYYGTPLCCAEDRRMAALLIAAGADVNRGQASPLHEAALSGRMDVLDELLSHPDINVNKQDEDYLLTPLHWAARLRRSECVAALLAAGADACIADTVRQTPLLFCFDSNKKYSEFRIIAMLVAAGDRQWARLPSPCPGLEAALLSVWKEAPQELGQLFSRLEGPVKRRIRAALCTMHDAPHLAPPPSRSHPHADPGRGVQLSVSMEFRDRDETFAKRLRPRR